MNREERARVENGREERDRTETREELTEKREEEFLMDKMRQLKLA